MLAPFFINILADPENGSSLSFDKNNGSLKNESDNKEFSIKDGVPILLPTVPTNIPETHELHRKFNTHFDYTEHYNIDPEFYDYSLLYNVPAIDHQFRRIHESILRKVPDNAELILDVGCGNGWVAHELCSDNRKVVSMDISLANPLRVNKAVNSPNHLAVVGDAYNLPFKSETFDVIIASEIIEHVSDPALFLKSLLRVLKKGGRLIVSTPYNEKVNYYLCVHCNKLTPQFAHLNVFNEKNFGSFLPEGVQITDIQIYNNAYLPKLRLYNIFKYFPFGLWRLFDKFANILTKKATCFTICIEK